MPRSQIDLKNVQLVLYSGLFQIPLDKVGWLQRVFRANVSEFSNVKTMGKLFDPC